MDTTSIAALFTLQLCVILLVCLAFGGLLRRLGQPPVIGEMIAGVVLGPSLFGLVAPELQGQLFPPDSPTMTILYTLSQLGLVLYMFVIGMELDLGTARTEWRTTTSVAAAGFVVPLLCGAVLAVALLAEPGLMFSAAASYPQAALFLGAAMATTAFPAMGRMLQDAGIARTRLASVAMSAGASTDAVTWIMLAVTVAVFHSEPRGALVAVTGLAVYVAIVLLGGRRLFLAAGRAAPAGPDGRLRHPTIVIALVMIFLGGWFTTAVGIHAIFGGFLLGVVVPRSMVGSLVEVIEPLVRAFLLPLFFVYSGLNTQIGLLDSPGLWAIALGVSLLAVLGKGLPCYLAARRHGLSPCDALAVGSLMNARGLIELILLDVGLSAGLITPTLFTTLVVMAVLTTLTSGCLFILACRLRGARPARTRASRLRPRPVLRR